MNFSLFFIVCKYFCGNMLDNAAAVNPISRAGKQFSNHLKIGAQDDLHVCRVKTTQN